MTTNDHPASNDRCLDTGLLKAECQHCEIERLRAALESAEGALRHAGLVTRNLVADRAVRALSGGSPVAQESDCSAGIGGVTLVQMAENIKLGLDPYTEGAPSAVETTGGAEVPWILWFSDVDRELVHFAGYGAESAARRAFHQASDAWTCRLYRCVDQTGYGPRPSTEETSERRDYAAVRDAHDRTVQELGRYKQALTRANGFLIMHGHEPVKLEYSQTSQEGLATAGSSAAVNPRETVGGSAEPSGRPANQKCINGCGRPRQSGSQHCDECDPNSDQ